MSSQQFVILVKPAIPVATGDIFEGDMPQIMSAVDRIESIAPNVGEDVAHQRFVIGSDAITYQNLSGGTLPMPTAFPASGFVPNTEELDHYPNIHPSIIAADVDGETLFEYAGVDGAFTKKGVRPFDVALTSGQSNARGQYTSSAYNDATGVDSGVNPRVLSWTGNVLPSAAGGLIVDGTALVVGQEGSAPYTNNNIGLQSSRLTATARRRPCIHLNYSKGSTALEQWLMNPPQTDTDMYTAIKTGIEDMFAFAGVDPFPINIVTFIQGGSNESLNSLSLTRRTGGTGPLISWAGGILELHDRFIEEAWFDASTLFILGEGAQGSIDSFNAGIVVLHRSGLIPNMHSVRMRFVQLQSEFDPTSDDSNHFSGDGLTTIGQRVSNIELNPSTATVPTVIDQPMTLPLADFDHDIEHAWLFAAGFDFADNGGIDLLMSQTIELDGVITLKGVPRDKAKRISICGELTGTQGAMLEGDYVGGDVEADRAISYPTDLATAQGLYQYHINSQSSRCIETDTVVLLKNILGYCNPTSVQDLIDVVDGGELVTHNVTLFGGVSNGSATVVDIRNGGIRLMDVSATPSALSIGYGRGNNSGLRGSHLSIENGTALLPDAVFARARLQSIISEGRTYIDVSGAKFQDFPQSAVDAHGFTKVDRDGATFTRTGDPVSISGLSRDLTAVPPPPPAAPAAPTGGATIDAEARATLNALLTLLSDEGVTA